MTYIKTYLPVKNVINTKITDTFHNVKELIDLVKQLKGKKEDVQEFVQECQLFIEAKGKEFGINDGQNILNIIKSSGKTDKEYTSIFRTYMKNPEFRNTLLNTIKNINTDYNATTDQVHDTNYEYDIKGAYQHSFFDATRTLILARYYWNEIKNKYKDISVSFKKHHYNDISAYITTKKDVETTPEIQAKKKQLSEILEDYLDKFVRCFKQGYYERVCRNLYVTVNCN